MKKNIRTFFFQFYNNKNRTSLLIWRQNIFQKWSRLMCHYSNLITMKGNYNMSYLMRLYTFYSCSYCKHNCLSYISLFTTPCHLISEVTVLTVSITSSCKSVTTWRTTSTLSVTLVSIEPRLTSQSTETISAITCIIHTVRVANKRTRKSIMIWIASC